MNDPMSEPDHLEVRQLFHAIDRLRVASLHRCRRSRVHCRESKRLVNVSGAGLARGRLLLDRTKAHTDG
jgi:hypothetical protein